MRALGRDVTGGATGGVVGGGRRSGRSERGRALAGAAILGLVVALGLTACTDSPPEPDEAAKALAQGLASGDLSHVELADGTTTAQAQQQRTDAFDGLFTAFGDDALTVRLEKTQPHEDDSATADVTFAWTWATGAGDDWTYRTTTTLTRDDDDVWQAAWSPALLAPDLQGDEDLVVTRQAAPRANVLGADDEVVVEARDVYRIGIDKTFVGADELDAAARGLAQALDLDADAYAARVQSAGAKAFVEAIVVRTTDADYDVAALKKLPGVNAVADSLPLAPTRTFARPILGAVGQATAEIVEKSGGAIQAGDLTGLSGLQRQYDEQLRGTPGLRIEARGLADSPLDGQVRLLDATDPVPGSPLRTTLDVDAQVAAEQILDGVGPASAIVALRPSTGKVLVAASGPGGEGMSTSTLGQYAPGSTFKVVSTLALLRAGYGADTVVTCPDGITVDGRQFDNFPDYPASALGQVPLRTAFANSCNTAFIGLRDEAPQDALVDAAGSLGLLPADPLGFASFLGAVPTESDGTDHAATMIGQGRVLASPLGMATVAASVAAGHTVVPQLVVGTTPTAAPADPSTEPTPSATAQDSRPHVDLTADESATLQTLMRGVVTDGGAAFLQDVPGPAIAAKTGTAQFGPADDLRNHVWMIAIQGDLAVAVFVDEGEYGSTTAGPLLRSFLESSAVSALVG